MIGTRIGLYEIVEEIGKGGMATVYRAYQPNIERYVAVKIIHKAIAADPQAAERFNREARLIARLEHPHIVPVYDYDAKHDPPYIVMRYLESGNLRDVLDRQGKLPLQEVAYMIRQVAGALDYAHRQGVVHRDIKPSNIMVDPDGNIFLMDFGIARITEGSHFGLTQTGFAVGTPGYMSPEQGLGESDVDGRTDIYALGAMLFEMATGNQPFTAETPMAVILRHIQDELPKPSSFNPELPPEFDAVVAKAMAKKREDRYKTAGELAEAVTTVVGAASAARTPTMLRAAAQEALRDLQLGRVRRIDEISRTMAKFETDRVLASRTPTGVRLREMEDLPTMTPPVDQPAASIPANTPAVNTPAGYAPAAKRTPESSTAMTSPMTGARTPQRGLGLTVVVGALVLLVAVIAGVAFLVENDGDTSGTEADILVGITTDEPSTQEPTPEVTGIAATNTPSVAVIELQAAQTLRAGPGTTFEVVQTLEADTRLEIIGVSEDSRWYQVLLPDGSTGWIVASPVYATAGGDLSALPVATADPLPTETEVEEEDPTPAEVVENSTPAEVVEDPTPTEEDTLAPTAEDTPTDEPTAEPTEADDEEPTATRRAPRIRATTRAGAQATREARQPTEAPIQATDEAVGAEAVVSVIDFTTDEEPENWDLDTGSGTEIINGLLRAGGELDLRYEGEPLTDFKLTFDVATPFGANFNIYLRQQERQFTKLTFTDDDRLEIKVMDRQRTVDERFASAVYLVEALQTIEITVRGNQITVLLDGSRRFEGEFEGMAAAGIVRFEVTGYTTLEFDNITLTDLTAEES